MCRNFDRRLKIHELKRKIPNLNPGELLDYAFAIPPCPNLYFQRDPMALTPGGIIFSSMKMEGRQREADLLRTIFEHHPILGSMSKSCILWMATIPPRVLKEVM